MNRNQRGSVLVNQLKTLKAMQEGRVTQHQEEDIDNNPKKSDSRDYGVGAQILRALGIRKLKLLTNNPVKRIGIRSFGLEIVDQVTFDNNLDLFSPKKNVSLED